MFIQYGFSACKTYIPLAMGVIYFINNEKQKEENILKFFVLRTFLCLLEYCLNSIFNLNESTIIYFLLPVYIYLSIFSYCYSTTNYDIIFAPLLQIGIDYHSDLINQVQKQRNRIKILEQHGKSKPGQIKEEEFMSSFQRLIYKLFKLQNMYLLK